MKTHFGLSVFAAACVTLMVPALSHAHGNHDAMHGGIVKSVGESIVELVAGAQDARVHLRDEEEGKPLGVSGGKLIVLRDGARAETALTPDGSGALVAKGVKLVPGMRVSVQIILADGQSRVAANFAIP